MGLTEKIVTEWIDTLRKIPLRSTHTVTDANGTNQLTIRRRGRYQWVMWLGTPKTNPNHTRWADNLAHLKEDLTHFILSGYLPTSKYQGF